VIAAKLVWDQMLIGVLICEREICVGAFICFGSVVFRFLKKRGGERESVCLKLLCEYVTILLW
jgi:hypothetical protein